MTMTMNSLSAPLPVIALHCSGGGAGQWRALGDVLGSRRALITPEHYGCESTGPWTGDHAFTLADEAQRTIAIIDRNEGNVHLVGHSYGAGVALHAAVERPDRIASLTLYEPLAFHLLRTMGERGAAALSEILAIAARTAKAVTSGNYRAAAISFVEYWSGRGAWVALRPSVQAALTRWMPKAPLDFRALISERAPASAYARFPFPVLIMRGERAPAPSRLVADVLASVIPAARLGVIAGAGHMGPLTHAPEVNAAIARHVTETDAVSIEPALPPLRRLERSTSPTHDQSAKGCL
jgi:pimeloyl-ACP methyl ester carboxylesterase